jgi:hypothetical protein
MADAEQAVRVGEWVVAAVANAEHRGQLAVRVTHDREAGRQADLVEVVGQLRRVRIEIHRDPVVAERKRFRVIAIEAKSAG